MAARRPTLIRCATTYSPRTSCQCVLPKNDRVVLFPVAANSRFVCVKAASRRVLGWCAFARTKNKCHMRWFVKRALGVSVVSALLRYRRIFHHVIYARCLSISARVFGAFHIVVYSIDISTRFYFDRGSLSRWRNGAKCHTQRGSQMGVKCLWWMVMMRR